MLFPAYPRRALSDGLSSECLRPWQSTYRFESFRRDAVQVPEYTGGWTLDFLYLASSRNLQLLCDQETRLAPGSPDRKGRR